MNNKTIEIMDKVNYFYARPKAHYFLNALGFKSEKVWIAECARAEKYKKTKALQLALEKYSEIRNAIKNGDDNIPMQYQNHAV